MKKGNADPRDVVYTSSEVGNLVLKVIDERRGNPNSGIRFGIDAVDEILLPLRPGELVTVMGRPGNYKTGLMQFWARRIANDIIEQDKEDSVVVYVTWEMAVEEMGLYDLASSTGLNAADLAMGKADDDAWEKLKSSAMTRSATPLWIVGHSIERRRKRPRLSMTAVAQALIWMEDNMGIHPDIIFLDYLQQIESERGEDRRMQIFENIHRAKDMALAMGCPVVMGVQANRDVDRRKWRLPELGDGMESSNIEHTADKMISVWKPDTSLDYGDFVTGTNLSVSKNLLIFGIQKQKMGPARNWKPLYIVPEKNEILNVDFSSVIGEDGEIQEELEGLESEDGFGVKERGLM